MERATVEGARICGMCQRKQHTGEMGNENDSERMGKFESQGLIICCCALFLMQFHFPHAHFDPPPVLHAFTFVLAHGDRNKRNLQFV